MGRKTDGTLWSWGINSSGRLGLNQSGNNISSPAQIPGTSWSDKFSCSASSVGAIRTDGTLWVWGAGNGALGQNNRTFYSSPIQIPGTTWKNVCTSEYWGMTAIKTDGTLWSWGYNGNGQLGQNQPEATQYSSPIQIPGTTWEKLYKAGGAFYASRKVY